MPQLPDHRPVREKVTKRFPPTAEEVTASYLHGFAFRGQVGEIVAVKEDEVAPALELLEQQVAKGLHAAGFISYEAAGAINIDLPGCRPGESSDFPLLWFGLFETRSAEPFTTSRGPFAASDWRPSLNAQEFAGAVAAVRDLIAAGDCYQVNLTMRQRFSFSGCPRAFFDRMRACQPTPYSCYLETGRYRILSSSPELFFSVKDGILTTRPMKGTAPRGGNDAEDLAQQQRLRETPKELAENVMIVDLLRNDMGVVSETGSVRVESLFDVETHPTVHQMTSTIISRLRNGVGPLELLRALFPCGSVTGAPKKRSMEIIAELEHEPRGLYTGCLGYFSPGGEAAFSVAIRTAVIDVESGEGVIGIGSGITYDSRAADEYAETLSKARFAQEPADDFQLIESLLYDGDISPSLTLPLRGRGLSDCASPVMGEVSARASLVMGETFYNASPATQSGTSDRPSPRRGEAGRGERSGYFLLERHLERLEASASYFSFRLEPAAARRALEAAAPKAAGKHKVRLLLSKDGRISCEAAPIVDPAPAATVTFADAAVHSTDPFLYHKTSRRQLFTRELAPNPKADEVIFLNERGEVTEGTISNVVARIGGDLFTPPVRCGLLPGVFREELVERGVIKERVLARGDLENAEELYLINSVRKWRRAQLVI